MSILVSDLQILKLYIVRLRNYIFVPGIPGAPFWSVLHFHEMKFQFKTVKSRFNIGIQTDILYFIIIRCFRDIQI